MFCFPFAAILFWLFSKCHVIKISKIFGDFVPRDSSLCRVFSRRSAILKIVEEKALGTRLELSSRRRPWGRGWSCYGYLFTCLRSRCSLWLKYKGSSDIMVYRPQVCVKCARTIAHNGIEENIAFHGIGTSCKRNKGQWT